MHIDFVSTAVAQLWRAARESFTLLMLLIVTKNYSVCVRPRCLDQRDCRGSAAAFTEALSGAAGEEVQHRRVQ